VAKGPEAFRTISEAAEEVGVPQHVLRFWETKFTFIKPMKRAGGRRFYRPSDLQVLRGVRGLLHEQGYTIKGVQRLHREKGIAGLAASGGGVDAPAPSAVEQDQTPAFRETPPAADASVLAGVLRELEAAKARLDAALAAGLSESDCRPGGSPLYGPPLIGA
jgi:DNA-binding transcriptional MerR regulator